MDDLTCIHQFRGLCECCQADYDEDPAAWVEFGNHPRGIANWEALRAELLGEGPPPEGPGHVDDSEIPF